MSKNCSGLHCPGCGGGGPAIGGVAGLVVLVLIAASARTIGHAVADIARVLVLIAAAGAGIAMAAGAVTAVLVIRSRLRRIERATGRMQDTLVSHGHGELGEPRAALPASSGIPAEVYIHPPAGGVKR